MFLHKPMTVDDLFPSRLRTTAAILTISLASVAHGGPGAQETLPAPALAVAGPAVVVLWTPSCLACRKSLQEIERFAARADEAGVAVTTVVPDEAHAEARELLTKRGIELDLEGDAGRIDAGMRRELLDRPVAYALDRDGRVVAEHTGLIGAWTLEGLAVEATRNGM